MSSGWPDSGSGAETNMPGEDLEELKRRLPLLDYLQRRNWNARRVGSRQEFVGLCPLRQETRPSFYVNAGKNLFYCHGCGHGGDLIRFVELSLQLSFRKSVARLQQELAPGAPSGPAPGALEQTLAFYQLQLPCYAEAVQYLAQRGLRDPGLCQELGIGYAPGGNLRRHLTALGYPFDLLLRTGLINQQGRDAFCRRVIFPCGHDGRIVNLYGRGVPALSGSGTAFPHRFLPGSKGGLFAWNSVREFSRVILVEGLFDLAVLWQFGFRNTTCAAGTHLTPLQLAHLTDRSDRQVYIAFDQDHNQAGQQAAHSLAQGLQSAGLQVHIVHLPAGHDPNSYFVAGASAADFARCLEQAQRPRP
jgi:DNA primase